MYMYMCMFVCVYIYICIYWCRRASGASGAGRLPATATRPATAAGAGDAARGVR